MPSQVKERSKTKSQALTPEIVDDKKMQSSGSTIGGLLLLLLGGAAAATMFNAPDPMLEKYPSAASEPTTGFTTSRGEYMFTGPEPINTEPYTDGRLCMSMSLPGGRRDSFTIRVRQNKMFYGGEREVPINSEEDMKKCIGLQLDQWTQDIKMEEGSPARQEYIAHAVRCYITYLAAHPMLRHLLSA